MLSLKFALECYREKLGKLHYCNCLFGLRFLNGKDRDKKDTKHKIGINTISMIDTIGMDSLDIFHGSKEIKPIIRQ
jgi:hypothetical protein